MRIPAGAIVAGLTAALGCASLPPCPARGGPAWHEYSSEHFEVRTELEAEAALEVIRTLEETRAAMLAMAWGGLPGPSVRTRAVVLGSSGQLGAFMGYGIAGVYLRNAVFPPTIVFGGATFGSIDVLNHELAHDLSAWFLPFQPAWYSEGIATFLETIRYDRAKGRAFVGELSERRYRAIQRRGILDVDLLLGSMPTDIFELGPFETSSWILVHYLLNHQDAAFGRFQKRLGAMEPAKQAWRAEFPNLDSATLQDKLVNYAHSGQYVVSSRSIAPWLGKTKVRTMSDAEVHGVRAHLYSYLHPIGEEVKSQEARTELDEAMSASVVPIDALALAFYARHTKDDMARATLARRAADTHPESWLSWIMVADTTDPKGPAHQSAVARALALAPDEREVLARAAIMKASQGRWDDALSFSSMALRGRSLALDLWMVHLTALAKTGQCAEAARWATAVVGTLPAEPSRAIAKHWEQLKPTCIDAPEPKPDNAPPLN